MAAPVAAAFGTPVVNSSATASCVLTPPALSDGDVVIVALSKANTVAVTPGTGFTEDVSVAYNSNQTLFFSKVIVTAASEPSTYTFSWTGGARNVGHIGRVTGADQTTPVAASPAGNTGTDASPDPPASGSVTSGDFLAVAIRGSEGKGLTTTGPTSYTERDDDGTGGGGSAAIAVSQSWSTQGLTTITSEDPGVFTMSAAEDWGALTILIQDPAGTAFTETPTDPVGVTDSTTAAKGATQTVTDPVGVIDAITRVHDAVRSSDEALGVADAITTAKASPRTVTDPVGVADVISVSKGATATVTDPVGVTDATSRVHDATRTPTDPVGVADTITTAKASPRTVTDPIGVTDSVSAELMKLETVTEALGVADAVTAAKAAAQTVTDPVGVADDTTTAKASPRTVADPVGVADAVTAAKTINVTVTDPIGVADSTSAAKAAAVTVGDTVGVADGTSFVLSGVGALTETVTDPVGVADVVQVAKTITVTITDTVGVTDETLIQPDTVDVSAFVQVGGATAAVTSPRSGSMQTLSGGSQTGGSAVTVKTRNPTGVLS